jgi:hypothetical protein
MSDEDGWAWSNLVLILNSIVPEHKPVFKAFWISTCQKKFPYL